MDRMAKSDCENFNRRDFMHVGALSLTGMGLASLFASEAAASLGKGICPEAISGVAPARNVILVWLSGGPSTIDMWDLKPNATKGVRGEFNPISTSADGVAICEHLPRMAEQMKHCSLVRSLGHTVAEHGQGTEYVITGNPINPSLEYPSIDAVVSSRTNDVFDVPVSVDLSGQAIGGAGFLGASHNPVAIQQFAGGGGGSRSRISKPFELPDGFTVTDLNRRQQLLQQLEQGFRQFDRTERGRQMSEFQQKAAAILSSGKTREALDLSAEPDAIRQRYGFSPLGQSALAARRLIQAGVRFVTIGIAGWDTHTNNFNQLRQTLLPGLDGPLAALIADLESTGLLDETIVYCVGEFNRTPSINGAGGRDHWARSMSALVAGGGIKRGFVFGSTDKHGMEPDLNPCTPTDLNATVLNQLGIGPETILRTRSGRPVQAFRDGNLLEDLIS